MWQVDYEVGIVFCVVFGNLCGIQNDYVQCWIDLVQVVCGGKFGKVVVYDDDIVVCVILKWCMGCCWWQDCVLFGGVGKGWGVDCLMCGYGLIQCVVGMVGQIQLDGFQLCILVMGVD